MRLNSAMVIFAPSSNVAITVSSGPLGIAGDCAHTEGRQTKRAAVANFMGGFETILTRARALPSDGDRRRLRSRVTALDLDPPPPLLEVVRRLLPRGIADLNAIVHRGGSARLRQPGGDALVLDHVRATFERSDAALHANRKMVGIDLRFGQFGADRRFDLGICRTRRRGPRERSGVG